MTNTNDDGRTPVDADCYAVRFTGEVSIPREAIADDPTFSIERMKKYWPEQVEAVQRNLESRIWSQCVGGVTREPSYYQQCADAARQQLDYLEGRSDTPGVHPDDKA